MLKQEQVKTPELNKISRVREDSQQLGEFLEWLSEQEIVLAEWTGNECDECGDEPLMRISQTTEQLLANYFVIDLAKAEKERVALLEAVREDNKAESEDKQC